MLVMVTPAFAVEATLVADTHVNSALPAVNSGASFEFERGWRVYCVAAVRPGCVAGGDYGGAGVAGSAAAVLQSRGYGGAGECADARCGHGVSTA